jgi:hypothetical protein
MITQTAVYLVPFGAVRKAVGSRNRKLLRATSERCANLLAEADENRDDDIERTCGQALADLINGADLGEVPEEEGYLYGLALEALCAHLGEAAGEVDGDWNKELDAFLSAHGVPLRFSDLVFGEEVIDLPPTNAEYPIIGSWSPEAAVAASAPLRALDLRALAAKDQQRAHVVGDVVRWVQEASQRPGWGLVGFSL